MRVEVAAVTLGAVLAAYAYFTLWVVVVPLIDADHAVHAFFPERYWALALPVTGYVTAMSWAAGVYCRLMRG